MLFNDIKKKRLVQDATNLVRIDFENLKSKIWSKYKA